MKENPTDFWYFLKSKSGSSLPRALTFGDRVIDDPQEIVNNFATLFTGAFITPDSCTKFSMPNIILDTLVITDVEKVAVYNAIRELKPIMTMGPDLIPSMVIRDCVAVFARIPLLYSINSTY